MIKKGQPSYGGEWTRAKLKILGKYLDSYTTALKNVQFNLVYIDAFAGKGYVELAHQIEEDEDYDGFIRGSSAIAVDIKDKQFDKLIFVEKDPDQCKELEKLRAEYPDRNILIENSEANVFLRNMQEDWGKWRGVLFLDPFATQVEWSTIETIASFKALDTWILFPVSAIARILRRQNPENIKEPLTNRLSKVFGDESWRDVYHKNPQMNLFEPDKHEYERNQGVDSIIAIYKTKLEELFGNRVLDRSVTLKNSKNSPLFEFLFCVGNEAGIGPAKKIAGYILDHM